MAIDKNKEYPRQIFSAVHTNQTLGVDAWLDAAAIDGTIPVLEGHTGYSRFKVTIIDAKGTDKVIVSANILHSEVPYLLQQYEMALLKLAMPKPETSKAGDAVVSPAYTVKITVGRDFNGKTPAEVLLENPSSAAALQRQAEWLNRPENISRYPKNADIIAAIEDAISLHNAGKLCPMETGAASGNGTIEIFREEFKVMRAPKGNEDKRIGAQIFIICDPDKENKWCFTVRNSLHPLDGANINRKVALKDAKSSIWLNDKEMALFIYKLKNVMRDFEELHFGAAWQHVLDTTYRPTSE